MFRHSVKWKLLFHPSLLLISKRYNLNPEIFNWPSYDLKNIFKNILSVEYLRASLGPNRYVRCIDPYCTQVPIYFKAFLHSRLLQNTEINRTKRSISMIRNKLGFFVVSLLTTVWSNTFWRFPKFHEKVSNGSYFTGLMLLFS